MAAPMGRFSFFRFFKSTGINSNHLTYKTLKRSLLSQSFECRESWNKRLSAPVFQTVKDTSDFAISLRDIYDQTGSLSAIDMDILANRLYDIPPSQLDYMEELFECFGKTQNVLQMTKATVGALVRAYIHHNELDRLLNLIQDKIKHRIFLDNGSANLLMDYFINNNQIDKAAKVCYDFALQENFSHPTTRLLALYTCSQYIDSVSLVTTINTEDDSGEEDWIPVKYINNPHFDFHFDLTDDKMLLGKTLLILSHELQGVCKINFEVIGYAFFEQFDKALEKLNTLTHGETDLKIHRNILDKCTECLELVTTRDPSTPIKEPGFLRNEDDRDLYRPTQEEKELFLSQLKEIITKLEKNDSIIEDNFFQSWKNDLITQIEDRDTVDVAEQTETITGWMQQREDLLNAQIKEHYIKQKKDKMVSKLKELQEKEELLTYFEKEHKIDIAGSSAPKLREVIDYEALKIERFKQRKVRIAACPNPEE